MSAPNEKRAVAAAVQAATAAGVRVSEPELLYAGSSLIVALGRDGPIARVGGTTDGVRDLDAHYRREVAVASWLADASAPVVAPWKPAGPLLVGDAVVALWSRAAAAEPPEPTEAARGLLECHRALRTFPGSLPHVSYLIAEAQRIAGSLALQDQDRDVLDRAFTAVLRLVTGHQLPEQALHGDAGLGNVLTGGVWHDWEDACQGPIIWDLASLVSTAHITGRRLEEAEQTLEEYGDAPGLDQLDAFVAARGVQVLAWSLLASAKEGKLRSSTATRLRWLRQREWVV